MKGKFKYRVLYLYSITQAGCSPLAIEWLEVFFVLTSVVEEASGTLLRLQVVQVALLQVALRSSSSVFREHFYFCLGTCSRLMDTPTSLRIPYILLQVMLDCCREKHFNIFLKSLVVTPFMQFKRWYNNSSFYLAVRKSIQKILYDEMFILENI